MLFYRDLECNTLYFDKLCRQKIRLYSIKPGLLKLLIEILYLKEGAFDCLILFIVGGQHYIPFIMIGWDSHSDRWIQISIG